MSEYLRNESNGGREASATNTMKGYNHKRFNNSSEYIALVRTAAWYYDSMRELRKKWKRNVDYYMGRQLEDYVTYNGRRMKVRDYMELKGMPALSNDIISDKMITLKGLVRQEYLTPTIKSVDSGEEEIINIYNRFLRQNDNNNDMPEQAAEQFERHASLGFIGTKTLWAFREGRQDVYNDVVDPFMVAVPPFKKRDLSDIEFIAEAHDLTWPQLVKKLYKKPGDEEQLQKIYAGAQRVREVEGYNDTGRSQIKHLDDFYHSGTVGKYRVIEIWTLERNRALWCHDRLNGTVGYRDLSEKAEIDAENAQRRRDNYILDEYGSVKYDELGNPRTYVPEEEVQVIEYKQDIEELWYYRLLSPNGYLLEEGRSPYKVLRNGYSFYIHPYTWLAYPCLEGEIRSFEDRLMDKQRQFNHDNIMLDFIIMNSSKGALAIDEESLTDNMSIEDIAEQYVKVDGTILYTSKKGGNIPQAIQNKSLPAGIEYIIKRDEAMIVGQSGVQPSLQGVHHNTSGKQYQIEKESSATAVTDYVSAFNNFRLRVAKKQMYMIQQYYDSNRSISIVGEDVKMYFNEQTMRDLGFDMAMTLDVNSATIRESMKDFVWQVYLRDEIDLGAVMENADFGDTSKLKKAWQAHKQEKMQQAMAAQQAQMQAQAGGASAGSPAAEPQGTRAGGSTNINAQAGAAHLLNPADTGRSTLVGTSGASS